MPFRKVDFRVHAAYREGAVPSRKASTPVSHDPQPPQPVVNPLPPAVVAAAGFYPLRDEGAAYAEKLEQAGVPVRYRCYENLSHSFTAFGGVVPAARSALEEIAVDVERAFTGAPL